MLRKSLALEVSLPVGDEAEQEGELSHSAPRRVYAFDNYSTRSDSSELLGIGTGTCIGGGTSSYDAQNEAEIYHLVDDFLSGVHDRKALSEARKRVASAPVLDYNPYRPPRGAEVRQMLQDMQLLEWSQHFTGGLLVEGKAALPHTQRSGCFVVSAQELDVIGSDVAATTTCSTSTAEGGKLEVIGIQCTPPHVPMSPFGGMVEEVIAESGESFEEYFAFSWENSEEKDENRASSKRRLLGLPSVVPSDFAREELEYLIFRELWNSAVEPALKACCVTPSGVRGNSPDGRGASRAHRKRKKNRSKLSQHEQDEEGVGHSRTPLPIAEPLSDFTAANNTTGGPKNSFKEAFRRSVNSCRHNEDDLLIVAQRKAIHDAIQTRRGVRTDSFHGGNEASFREGEKEEKPVKARLPSQGSTRRPLQMQLPTIGIGWQLTENVDLNSRAQTAKPTTKTRSPRSTKRGAVH